MRRLFGDDTRILPAIAVAFAALTSGEARADDIADGDRVRADAPADIGSFYAWSGDDGTLNVALTFGGLYAAGEVVAYDRDVLYTVCVDNTASVLGRANPLANTNDNVCDVAIDVRFGQNELGEWGVRVDNLPGADGPVTGPVGTVINEGGASVFAGLRDNPHFEDRAGLNLTWQQLLDSDDPLDLGFALLSTGFAVDTLAGTNTGAIVLQFDAGDVSEGNTLLQLWATTGRVAE